VIHESDSEVDTQSAAEDEEPAEATAESFTESPGNKSYCLGDFHS